MHDDDEAKKDHKKLLRPACVVDVEAQLRALLSFDFLETTITCKLLSYPESNHGRK